jgi:hypothetical protein
MLLGHLVPQHAETNEGREGVIIIHNPKLLVDPLPASKHSFLPYKNNLTNKIGGRNVVYIRVRNKLYSSS